ncbi:MAG: hypothetical protein QXJ75_01645 [Candidatus Bathyarchaeia archaeon]
MTVTIGRSRKRKVQYGERFLCGSVIILPRMVEMAIQAQTNHDNLMVTCSLVD